MTVKKMIVYLPLQIVYGGISPSCPMKDSVVICKDFIFLSVLYRHKFLCYFNGTIGRPEENCITLGMMLGGLLSGDTVMKIIFYQIFLILMMNLSRMKEIFLFAFYVSEGGCKSKMPSRSWEKEN